MEVKISKVPKRPIEVRGKENGKWKVQIYGTEWEKIVEKMGDRRIELYKGTTTFLYITPTEQLNTAEKVLMFYYDFYQKNGLDRLMAAGLRIEKRREEEDKKKREEEYIKNNLIELKNSFTAVDDMTMKFLFDIRMEYAAAMREVADLKAEIEALKNN